MSTDQLAEDDDRAEPARFPSPDALRSLLAEHGYDPDDLGQMTGSGA
jgi:hypothetical protein